MSHLVNYSGDAVVTGISKQEEIKVKLNETYVISRVFLYPKTSDLSRQNRKLNF